jgi:hypothetical protein
MGSRLSVLLVFLAVTSCRCGVSSADHEELKLVPARTVGVIRVRSVDGLRTDVQRNGESLLEHLRTYAPDDTGFPRREEIEEGLRDMPALSSIFGDRVLEACAADRPCYAFAVLPVEQTDAEEPTAKPAMLLPCNDLERLQRAILGVDQDVSFTRTQRDDGFVAASHGEQTGISDYSASGRCARRKPIALLRWLSQSVIPKSTPW